MQIAYTSIFKWELPGTDACPGRYDFAVCLMAFPGTRYVGNGAGEVSQIINTLITGLSVYG